MQDIDGVVRTNSLLKVFCGPHHTDDQVMEDLLEPIYNSFVYYLPTPPFGQDMTQGQFLSGV